MCLMQKFRKTLPKRRRWKQAEKKHLSNQISFEDLPGDLYECVPGVRDQSNFNKT